MRPDFFDALLLSLLLLLSPLLMADEKMHIDRKRLLFTNKKKWLAVLLICLLCQSFDKSSQNPLRANWFLRQTLITLLLSGEKMHIDWMRLRGFCLQKYTKMAGRFYLLCQSFPQSPLYATYYCHIDWMSDSTVNSDFCDKT